MKNYAVMNTPTSARREQVHMLKDAGSKSETRKEKLTYGYARATEVDVVDDEDVVLECSK